MPRVRLQQHHIVNRKRLVTAVMSSANMFHHLTLNAKDQDLRKIRTINATKIKICFRYAARMKTFALPYRATK